MQAVGAKATVSSSSRSTTTARNPDRRLREYNAILALKRDGGNMTGRDKGAVYVYPYQNPELRTSSSYTRRSGNAKFGREIAAGRTGIAGLNSTLGKASCCSRPSSFYRKT